MKITIESVPEHVRDQLAARAARKGQSMQAFLLGELERVASERSVEEWLREVRERVEASGTGISAADILEARDADRT